MALKRPGFPGVGVYLDKAAAGDLQLRAQAADDCSLNDLGNLLGQAEAYGPGPAAEGIFAEALARLRILECRVEAASLALTDVGRSLRPDEASP